MLCDCILTCERLTYQNAEFWVECFNLIRKVIGGVDYKGVREIMKVCLFDNSNNIELDRYMLTKYMLA